MIKTLLFTLMMVSTVNLCFGQNPSHKLFVDSIMFQFDSLEYKTLKGRFLQLDKDYSIDPSNELIFLGLSIENNDKRFYKKRLKSLIRKHGFSYSISDTLGERKTTGLLIQVHLQGESQWLSKLSQKHFSHWVKKNPLAYKIQNEINTLAELDQMSVRMFSSYAFDESTSDSTKNKIKDILFKSGRSNIDRLAAICEEIGTFPNNYDFGIGSYFKLGALIDHSLEAKENFHYAWDKLFPYLEKAYLEGKIDHSFFLFYDMHSAMHFGTQRFGFAPEFIPMEDEENWITRKEKYGL